MIYAVIDTNVLVSALLSVNEDAATVQVVRKMLSGEIIPVYSSAIVKEYRDVLNRKKFGFSIAVVTAFLSAIERSGVLLEPVETSFVLPDRKDLPFYEVVLEKRKTCDNTYLVTGNGKHFPAEPFIVTPKELLVILSFHSSD